MTVRVFDAEGNEKDMLWAREKYNLPLIDKASKEEDHWEVVELHESIGPSSMTVRGIAEHPSGLSVAFGWPDGLDFQDTNAKGQTGFGMGPGAYYNPEEGHGPHFTFMSTIYPSDEVTGLGMIGKTNHEHLEPTFQFVKAKEEPEPEPGEGRTFHIEATVTIREEK